MESKSKFLGHPIHQLLVVFPLGLLITSVIFDGFWLLTRSKRFATSAFMMMGAGVVSGLAAAVFGLVDWLAIPFNTRAKKIGLWHGLGNVVVTLFFGASWLLRRERPERPGTFALIFALLGAAVASVTGWLGGELVDRLGVGVHTGANLNAPNSLYGEPAGEKEPEPPFKMFESMS